MLLELGVNKMTKFPQQKTLQKVRDRLNKTIASRPLSENANEVDRVKFHICKQFVIYKNAHRMSQRELAQKIGIDESLMSKILHYHFDSFTTDRLIKYLCEIYPKTSLSINVA